MNLCNSCETILKFNELSNSISFIEDTVTAIFGFILLFLLVGTLVVIYSLIDEHFKEKEDRKKIFEKILKEKD